jgi:hypothetical protein
MTARAQSDQVALAVDGKHYVGPPDAPYRPWIGNPLSDTFYKNCIASGSIVPPFGESRNVRRQDFIVGCVVCLFVAAGIAAFLIGLLWRH